MLDIFLIVVGALCLLAGMAGCVLPVLPGPPISYVGLLLLHVTDKVQFTTTQLLVWLLVVVVMQVLDYFIPMLGSKYFGGSKWGNWGCVVGTLAGSSFCRGALFSVLSWGHLWANCLVIRSSRRLFAQALALWSVFLPVRC